MNQQPCLVITPGEPAGIGPDLMSVFSTHPPPIPVIIVADKTLITSRLHRLNCQLDLIDYPEQDATSISSSAKVYIKHIPLKTTAKTGELNQANADYVLDCLRTATSLCLTHPHYALVTGPIHKGIINQAGYAFSGHTEFLAEQAQTPLTVMMLATTGLRVALATTHLALKDVPAQITTHRLQQVLTILHTELITKFSIAQPHICVCGLNPHAGEEGHLGHEEIDIIIPVLEQLRSQGLNLTGPLPADTAFTQQYMPQMDAYLAMYHDQGLPVLKHVGFGNAVNITLGLPFIRTSVDHGTALDLAGTGHADPQSLLTAIQTAQHMLTSRDSEFTSL